MILRTIFLLLVLRNLFCAAKADDDELRLINDLFANYNKNVRPAKDKSEPIQVKFGIAYTQIVDLIEKDQTLVSNIWVRMQWYNNLLRWNSSHYGGIKSINLSPLKIWLPDIVLHNNAEETLPSGTLYQFKTRVILDSDGKNTWYAPTILRSGCSIDITYFPFDDQLCELKFGSWTYHGFQVNVVEMSNEADLASYMKSSEFMLVSAKAKRNVVFYSCCPEPYPDVTFYLHLRRKPGFYLFNIIIPTLVMSLLGILTFILPPEFGERITLVIESFLAMSLIVMMVMEKVPVTSDVTPLIIKMLLISMVQIGLMLVANCIALNCWRDSTVPEWIRVVFLHYMARMLFVNNGNIALENDIRSDNVKTPDAEIARMKLSGTNPLYPTLLPLLDNIVEENNINVNTVEKKILQRPANILNKLVEGVNAMTANELAEEQNELDREFWAFTSQVLDRLFLLIFTLVFICSSSYIFSRVPDHYTFSTIFSEAK